MATFEGEDRAAGSRAVPSEVDVGAGKIAFRLRLARDGVQRRRRGHWTGGGQEDFRDCQVQSSIKRLVKNSRLVWRSVSESAD